MRVYYEGEEYDWKYGSEDLKEQLELVKYNKLIYLVGEKSSIMVSLKGIHFHLHKK